MTNINTYSSPEESGFCPQCGTANARTAAFCAKCGAPLPWATPKAEPVAPQAASPQVVTPAPFVASVPPPPPLMPTAPMMPPPPPLSLPLPVQTELPVSPSGLPVGVAALAANLKADAAGKTPSELLRRYIWHIVGAALLILVVSRFASALVSLAALGALVSLVVGLGNPEKFRFLFGAKTSKAVVGWTFGGLFLLLVMILPSLQSKPEEAATVAMVPAQNGAPHVAPATVPVAPVQNAPAPTSVSVPKSAAQARVDAANARAQVKAQQNLAKKVAQTKRTERERQAAIEAQTGAELSATPQAEELPSKELPSNVAEVDIPGVGKRQVGVVDKIVYTVLSVEKVASIGRTQADGVFYLLHVVASNTAKKAHSITTVRMKMADDQERVFSASSAGNTELLMQGDQEAQFLTATLQPGVVKKFTLVFDAPGDATGLSLQIPKGTFSFGQSASIKMPGADE